MPQHGCVGSSPMPLTVPTDNPNRRQGTDMFFSNLQWLLKQPFLPNNLHHLFYSWPIPIFGQDEDGVLHYHEYCRSASSEVTRTGHSTVPLGAFLNPDTHKVMCDQCMTVFLTELESHNTPDAAVFRDLVYDAEDIRALHELTHGTPPATFGEVPWSLLENKLAPATTSETAEAVRQLQQHFDQLRIHLVAHLANYHPEWLYARFMTSQVTKSNLDSRTMRDIELGLWSSWHDGPTLDAVLNVTRPAVNSAEKLVAVCRSPRETLWPAHGWVLPPLFDTPDLAVISMPTDVFNIAAAHRHDSWRIALLPAAPDQLNDDNFRLHLAAVGRLWDPVPDEPDRCSFTEAWNAVTTALKP